MENRDIICLQCGTASMPPFNELQAEGWIPHIVDAAAKARSLIKKLRPTTGFVVFNQQMADANVDDVEDLLALTDSVRWFGLIDPALIDHPDFRRGLEQFLAGFMQLPVTAAQLNALIGERTQQPASRRVKRLVPAELAAGYDMIGVSPAMREVFSRIDKVAAVDSPVLVRGESGTGKELATRAIHRKSRRAEGPFVAVNCGAIPRSLIQSELFGHEKGAFTGAYQRQIGRIEAANGGTIFLDEIGDLPLDLQVNLLRFLQEKVIERVGGTEPIPVDVRVIAATHKDLGEAVQSGALREDLYYRLHVLHLDIPPLRERREDIEPLALYYFDQYLAKRDGSRDVRGFSTHALQAMYNYKWPGNIRELANKVEAAMVLCDSELIEPEDLGFDDLPEEFMSLSGPLNLLQARSEAERRAIRRALRYSGNNISQAARSLGISRVTLYRLIEKYDLVARLDDAI